MPTTFLALEVTPEAQFALRQLPKLDSIDELLALLRKHVAGVPPTMESFKQLQRSCSLDSHTAGGLFSGTDWLLRTAMRSALQPKALAAEFADVKVPSQFVQPLVAAVSEGRAALATQQDNAQGLPGLLDLRWRLDVRGRRLRAAPHPPLPALAPTSPQRRPHPRSGSQPAPIGLLLLRRR